MNKELLVTLLRKDIKELEIITEGFAEMSVYPKAIILLAQQKVDSIQSCLNQLQEANLQQQAEISNTKKEKNIEIPPAVTIIEETILETPAENIETLTEKVIKPDKEPKATPEVKLQENEQQEAIQTIATETQTTISSTRITTLGEVTSVISRNELLAKPDNSISATLANKKVDDIKQAINIADRFRFQRELFEGNGEDMNKTISLLNQFLTLDEAISFLQLRYHWDENNGTVSDFYQVVKRKFL